MKCLNCNVEDIDNDDNFCYNCGHWTARGYNILKAKDNDNLINYKRINRQNFKVGLLTFLLFIGIVTFIIMYTIQGQALFLPFKYLKKQADKVFYGYNTSIIKTDNKYQNRPIENYDDAIAIIKKDFQDQEYICNPNLELSKIEYELENDYAIPKVSFCDMDMEEAQKIQTVIKTMYNLFPNIKGSLTNITITNAPTKSEYIARFQPMYQFVNINEDLHKYNKVNKTQILLNSYYFLNAEILAKPISEIVKNNWYVTDATWESTIAHEIGHYISFVIFLKENNLANITLETSENSKQINDVVKTFTSNQFSLDIISLALTNFNQKYHQNLNINEFAKSISAYAGDVDQNNNLVADEVIAEAVHDYYLHRDNMQKSSREIINILKEKLGSR